jgi:hypothetical protein
MKRGRLFPVIAALVMTLAQSTAALSGEDSNWTVPYANTVSGGAVLTIASGSSGLYVGGSFTAPGQRIALWDGLQWKSLGSGISDSSISAVVLAIATDEATVYASGSFSVAGGSPAHNIARWNGTSWDALGQGVNGPVYALALQGSRLYVGGAFTTAGGNAASNIAYYDSSGWHSMNYGTSSAVYALAVKGNDVYVGGGFSSVSGIDASFIARWDGSNWYTLGSGTDGAVHALAVDDSSVYVGGTFTTAGGFPADHVAQWNGSQWFNLGTGISTITGYEQVYTLFKNGSQLYVGGKFLHAGSVSCKNLAMWDGTVWSALGSGVGGLEGFEEVQEVLVQGVQLVVGGSFLTAGTLAANGIAEWNTVQQTQLETGWNMISVPRNSSVHQAQSLFPQITSGTFYSYSGSSYMATDTLFPGVGYWGFASHAVLNEMHGQSVDSILVTVTSPGWVLFGSTTVPVPINVLKDTPMGSMVAGTLYTYVNGSYIHPSQFEHGHSYWVLINQPCTLHISR